MRYISNQFFVLYFSSLSLSVSSPLLPDLFINRCIFGYGTFHTCTKTRLELCTLYAAVHIPKPYPIFYTLFAIGICFRGNNQKKVVLLINQQLESAFHDLICRWNYVICVVVALTSFININFWFVFNRIDVL